MSGATLWLYRAFLVGALAFGAQATVAYVRGPATAEAVGDMWGYAILALFLGLLAIVMKVVGAAEARRRDAIQRVAEDLGFVFRADGRQLVGADFLELEPYRNIRLKESEWFNAMRGSVGDFPDVAVFDFSRSKNQYGGSTSSRRHTAVAFRLPADLRAEVRLLPGGVGDKTLANLRGTPVVQLPDDPGFSRRFVVRTRDDPAAVARMLPRAFRDALGRDGVWAVDAGRDWLVLWQMGGSPDPEGYARYIDEAHRLAATFAEHLAPAS